MLTAHINDMNKLWELMNTSDELLRLQELQKWLLEFILNKKIIKQALAAVDVSPLADIKEVTDETKKMELKDTVISEVKKECVDALTASAASPLPQGTQIMNQKQIFLDYAKHTKFFLLCDQNETNHYLAVNGIISDIISDINGGLFDAKTTTFKIDFEMTVPVEDLKGEGETVQAYQSREFIYAVCSSYKQ
jgi:hypothetical protein